MTEYHTLNTAGYRELSLETFVMVMEKIQSRSSLRTESKVRGDAVLMQENDAWMKID